MLSIELTQSDIASQFGPNREAMHKVLDTYIGCSAHEHDAAKVEFRSQSPSEERFEDSTVLLSCCTVDTG